MIKIKKNNTETTVQKDGKSFKVIDADENEVIVEVVLNDLKGIEYYEIPNELHMDVLLNMIAPADELMISKTDNGYSLGYHCMFYSKNWHGFVGQFDYLLARKHLLEESNLFNNIDLDEEDDPWQKLSFEKEYNTSDDIYTIANHFISDFQSVVNKLDDVVGKLRTEFIKEVGLK